FALGWRFRALGPAFVVALFAVLSYRSSWGMIFHSENLLLLHALVLAVAPSADVWSLDARRGAPPPRRHGHGWPLRVIAAVTVCAYLLAGIAKLRLNGWDWVTGEYLRHHVAYDALRKVQLGAMASPIGTAMVAHGWMFPPFAAFAVAVELGAPLGLVGRWPGRIWAVGIWLFHWGVLAVMGIPFHYALSGFAFVAFFDVERWARGLERWVRRRARAREPA
ncbi:MAG: HTTM domain-containing protein, partial [Deltaproteobacteria bacterium]|nr:HTTM domain-containing protein [Deltaproteobacteria bacterium]